MDETTGQQVVIEDLTENDILSEDLVLDTQDTFTLNPEVSDGTAYDFAVKTQPADQTCTFVGDSSGTVSGSEIALELDCTPGNTKQKNVFLSHCAASHSRSGALLQKFGALLLTSRKGAQIFEVVLILWVCKISNLQDNL